ncbi:MAG: YkgJ family cysteine cluster protein [Clostridiales bacterium]|nr:YkgJ family cysteine cluster protein [Clostridiales bacterium]MCF8021387.1 YkgJ family cysteine cluster protein [Clostridiales bacterium]
MMEITKLYTTLSYADNQGYLKQLRHIYDELPETECDKCATCCTVPPPGYLIEFLNLYKYIKDNLQDQQVGIMEKTIRYFFLELADVNIKCPFLDEKSNNCLVYPVRPLGCRIYGLMSKDDFGDGDKRSIEGIANKYREEYNIELPEEVLNFELPFCDRVCRLDGKKEYVSAELVQKMASNMEALEASIVPPQAVEEQYTFAPMPTHLALSVLTKGARFRRPRVIKEYLEKGTSEMLDGYVERFKLHTF